MLLISGLRAAELCSLHWRDIEEFDGKLFARFWGKGGKQARQELYKPVVQATRQAFVILFKRKPQADEFLFYSLPAFPGDAPRPMTSHRLWARIKDVGEKARAEVIIIRNVNFTPLLFRKTYATLLCKSGMVLLAIQQKIRHAEQLKQTIRDNTQSLGRSWPRDDPVAIHLIRTVRREYPIYKTY